MAPRSRAASSSPPAAPTTCKWARGVQAKGGGIDTEHHPHTNQNSINGDFSRAANAGINPNTVNTYLGMAGNVVVSAFAPATYTPIEAWTVTGGGPDTYAGKKRFLISGMLCFVVGASSEY